MNEILVKIKELFQNTNESDALAQEFICSQRMSYNNFDEKVDADSMHFYQVCRPYRLD